MTQANGKITAPSSADSEDRTFSTGSGNKLEIIRAAYIYGQVGLVHTYNQSETAVAGKFEMIRAAYIYSQLALFPSTILLKRTFSRELTKQRSRVAKFVFLSYVHRTYTFIPLLTTMTITNTTHYMCQ